MDDSIHSAPERSGSLGGNEPEVDSHFQSGSPQEEDTSLPSVTESTPATAQTTTDVAPRVDLRALEYVVDFDRNLMCPICHCPFIQAQRLSCDHTFCGDCFNRAIHLQSQEVKTCPTCRTPTGEGDALPVPRFLMHLIDDLAVRCPQQIAGCNTQMRRGDVQNHVDHYCQYAEVACPSRECQLKVARRDITRDCSHQTVSCSSCDMQMTKGQLQVWSLHLFEP